MNGQNIQGVFDVDITILAMEKPLYTESDNSNYDAGKNIPGN
jgi:hypothetical protein